MEKMYQFTKDAYVLFSDKKVAPKGFAFKHDISKHGYIVNINGCEVYLLDAIRNGYIEEILPDEKPISSESENPYGRQIYLAEAIHALTNHDVLIKDKYGYIWDYDKIDETFYTYDESGYTIVITDKYTVKELLEFQFDVIPKSIEETKSKWVEIETHKDLCNAIANKKMIRLGDGKPTNEYNDKQIETLFGALSHGVFKIEYLEEN